MAEEEGKKGTKYICQRPADHIDFLQLYFVGWECMGLPGSVINAISVPVQEADELLL